MYSHNRSRRAITVEHNDLTTEQDVMLEEALERPGVAEAMAVYQAAATRAPLPAVAAPSTRYALGANR